MVRRLSTPSSAALAGVVFALLFSASVALLRSVIPGDPFARADWAEAGEGRIRLVLALMPFAGIAFLWFVGVVRDHFGELEDRFLSSVFVGSALLFLAMVFVSMSLAGALLAGLDPGQGQRYD